MNLLGILSLLWQCLKLVIENKTVNTAMDNWTKGTSNEIDDAVWALLESVTGVKDEELKQKMLNDGLAAIEEKYVTAKNEGEPVLAMMKAPRRTWNPPSMDEIRSIMTGESITIGEG